MDVSITDITDVEKEISIQTTAEELTPHLEEAYKRYLPKIEIKGFRKGKAPLEMVKKIHGEMIEYNSLDAIASDVYRQVITERHIQPIGEPVLTNMDYKRGEQLSFKIKYEIKPAFHLQQYKGVPVERIVHRVTDDDVEREILNIRKSNSTMSEVATVTDREHVVTADIQQLDYGGTPLIGRKNANMKIYLAGGTVYQEIKNALEHASVGETKRVKFEATVNGGKQLNHLELTIKKIEKVILPDITDEFVKTITKEKTTTVVDFRRDLKQDIEKVVREEDERIFVDKLVNEIVRRHDFTVPESLVKGITDTMIEEMKSRRPDKKFPVDFDEKAFRDTNRPYALFQAKWYLIREQIIESEKLSVDRHDLEVIADREAPRIGIEKDRLITFYDSSDSVKDKMLGDKLIRFLTNHAVVAERVAEPAGNIDTETSNAIESEKGTIYT